jgi:Ca2+-binding EF-hand superfamily protein
LCRLGKRPTPEKIQKIIKEADKNNTGAIDEGEFVEYMINKKKLKSVTTFWRLD